MSGAKLEWTHLRNAFHGPRLYLLVAALVTSLVATGYIWAHKKVTISVDDATYEIKTTKYYVRECLAQAGISMDPQDAVNLPLGAKISNGTKIEIYRGGPVTIIADGKTVTSVMAKATVEDAVKTAGIVLQELDQLVPDRAARLRPGMEIRVIRVTENIETREKTVIFPVERRADDTLERGMTHVVQEGRDGIKREKVCVRNENGHKVAETVLEEQLISAPQPEIVLVGTRDTLQTSRGTMRFSRVVEMEASAYLPTDGSGDGVTATGIPARYGIVAVDPRVIPLGSRIYVKGYGMALAADTGGAIVGDKIDLCMENAEEAWSFGRRLVKVYVLAE
jgi:uncharacterized protein YabE (DUF348 family)